MREMSFGFVDGSVTCHFPVSLMCSELFVCTSVSCYDVFLLAHFKSVVFFY